MGLGIWFTEALSSRFAVRVKVSTAYDLATRQASGEIGWASPLRELLALAR
jgi:hypothetical protein